ncbi:amidohydrolase family protein [Streptomyces sp. NPDC049590]|uniref:amidohydrolase family protein n=1 Tax=Streptomyces sp. NPDC049590 TaxID=3154834 RepID=UPI00341D4819
MAWSPEEHLAFMDDDQVATSVLSLTAPSVVGWQGQERRGVARRVNEYVAELVTRHPDRFGNFATVPVPDVEGAVAEAEYALDELGADGVVLLSNCEGVYLGGPEVRAALGSAEPAVGRGGHPSGPPPGPAPAGRARPARGRTIRSAPLATPCRWCSPECRTGIRTRRSSCRTRVGSSPTP